MVLDGLGELGTTITQKEVLSQMRDLCGHREVPVRLASGSERTFGDVRQRSLYSMALLYNQLITPTLDY